MAERHCMKQKSIQPRLAFHSTATLRFLALLLTTTLLVFSACKKEDITDDSETAGASSERMGTANHKTASVVVKPGGSIQAAINAAPDGSMIKILAGTYNESIVVAKPGITLFGEGNVILQNPGTAAKGIVVSGAATGFTLKNITIQGFGERALDMTNVDGFLLSHVTVVNNGEFGLFAEYCKNGTIEHCEGSDHAETGIFVGQSINVNLLQNRMHGNVIGLEVENSSNIVLDKNHSYDNAVGIMCLLVPGRLITLSTNITITKNQVRENNHVNFSAPPEQESVLPSGLGILILGIDNAVIRDNHVTANKFAGIATLSSLIIGQLAGIPEAAFASIEPNPDHLRVISNQVKNNGYAPPVGLPLPGADLLWDGSGTDNCWSRNLYTISFPANLPACP